MRIKNLRKAATIGLALLSINDMLEIPPKKESTTDLEKGGVWQEKPKNNTCATPKVVDLENTLKVAQIKKDNNKNKAIAIRDECRWNDYVGTILQKITFNLTIQPMLLMARVGEKLQDEGLVDFHKKGTLKNAYFLTAFGTGAVSQYLTESVSTIFKVNKSCRPVNDKWNKIASFCAKHL